MSGLLGPTGSPYAELGGERAWLQREKGDIVISFQWLDLRPYGCDEEKGPEPVMVLFSAHRRMETGAKVIRQRDAHMYARSNGEPSYVLMHSAADAAECLGYSKSDRAAVTRIIDAIVENIPDLIRMPSDQPAALEVKQRVMGIEHTVKVGGQTIHTEIR